MQSEIKISSQMSLIEKLGLRFYSFILAHILTLVMAFVLKSGYLTLFSATFYTVVGTYLPLKADLKPKSTKQQNNNKFLLGPLIASCIETPVILFVMWRNYDILIEGAAFQIFCRFMGLAFATASSIDASHELLHRTQPICKFFSYFNLFFMQFTIYPTEHLYLHHKKVGSVEDPITSPKNRSVFAYYVHAILNCYKFTYSYSKTTFILTFGSTILYNLLLVLLSQRQGSPISKAILFSLFSYACLYILESVEYIEHYGLIYRPNPSEKNVQEICSWNATENELLNWLVFRFQRHSDHHMNAYKIYPTMQVTPTMPKFPFDFITGSIIAIIPPFWYMLMNPLVDEIIQGKKVSSQHKNFVRKSTSIVQFTLTALFPVGLVLHYLN